MRPKPSIARVALVVSLVASLLVLLPGGGQAVETGNGLVISQVYAAGGEAGSSYNADYVELFNRGGATASLETYKLQFAGADGGDTFFAQPWQRIILTGALAPGQARLIQLHSTPGGRVLPPPDQTEGRLDLATEGGKVVLVAGAELRCNGATVPCSGADRARIVDLVGYGTADFYEGFGPAPAGSATRATVRSAGGCVDTDANHEDLRAAAPAPRNATSLPVTACSANDTLRVIEGPDRVVVDVGRSAGPFSVVARDADDIVDTAAVSGLPNGVLFDAGTVGTTRRAALTIASNTKVGTYAITVTFTNAGVPTEQTVTHAMELVVTPPDPCGAPATWQIAQVQGAGAESGLVGAAARVEGVVTGVFPKLNGFFFQDDTPDSNPMTSEGLFVESSVRPAAGDRVRASGTVRAAGAGSALVQTTVLQADVDGVVACGTGRIVPTEVVLPSAPGAGHLERFEGMLVTVPGALAVADLYYMGQYGQVMLAPGRQMQPTDVLDPQDDAAAIEALADEAARSRIALDDGSNDSNPRPTPHAHNGFPRVGDSVTDATGVLSHGLGYGYGLHPLAPVDFTSAAPRPAMPAPVGGEVRVANFNVLNYFTTLGSRGAFNAWEFDRQKQKIVAAVSALDADVVGLQEIENNGDVAIADLVDGLNQRDGAGTWAWIADPTQPFGGDAIKVAALYKPAAVTPVGPSQTSTDPVFSRPPLVQRFTRTGVASEQFSIVVNHFKSKNPPTTGSPAPSDHDIGDGQGWWNGTRTRQAQATVDVVEELALPNALLLGDLNSYSEEDPVELLEEAGFASAEKRFVAPGDRHSYVFDGVFGALDHALMAPDAVDNVTGATVWHINTDEARARDYNDWNAPDAFSPDPYASSDHDPIVLGLDLAEAPGRPTVSVVPGWRAATVGWTGAPSHPSAPVSGYRVQVFDGTRLVADVTTDAAAREHTFGAELRTGVPYRFVVTALNAVGEGPAAEATETPFVPVHPKDVTVQGCAADDAPTITWRIDNPNLFPLGFQWLALDAVASGAGATAAGGTAFVTTERMGDRDRLRVYVDGEKVGAATACR